MNSGSTQLVCSSVALLLAFAAGCGTIRSHRELEQPLGSQLVVGVGGIVFRLNKLGDLPNAFGGRDIWGGKVNKGFAEIRLVAIEDRTLVLDIVDVDRQSSETTMDRYKPFQTNAVVDVDVSQSMSAGAAEGVKPNRLRLDTNKQREIVISGVRVRFLEVKSYSVRYTLEDLRPQ